jgi:hypothetical protein
MRDVRTNQPFTIVPVGAQAGAVARALLAKFGRPYSGVAVHHLGTRTPAILLPGPDKTVTQTLAKAQDPVFPYNYFSVDAFKVVSLVKPDSLGNEVEEVLGTLESLGSKIPEAYNHTGAVLFQYGDLYYGVAP